MEEEDKILDLEDEDEFFDDSSALRRILLVDVKDFVLLMGIEKSVLLVDAEEEDSSLMTPR